MLYPPRRPQGAAGTAGHGSGPEPRHGAWQARGQHGEG